MEQIETRLQAGLLFLFLWNLIHSRRARCFVVHFFRRVPSLQMLQSTQQNHTSQPISATNALLQILQRHNLSSEQAMGLARVIQSRPQLIGALLENLRQRQQLNQQPSVPPQPQVTRPPPQPQPTQQQPNSNSSVQQAQLLQLVRQKLLAAQAPQAKPVVNLSSQVSLPWTELQTCR